MAVIDDEVEILNDPISGEGIESFTLEINNVTLVPRLQHQPSPLSSDTEPPVLLHHNHSKLEITIDDDDG